MSTPLKRDAGIPLYQQLADKIKDQIAAGELKENEQLMTEMELSKAYNISRITVRKALELLVDEEILTKRQGIGAFVTGKKLLRSMNTMMGFTQTCEMNGQKATSRLLFAGLSEARPRDIRLFGIKEGDSVISVRRLRFCDDVPVMIEEVRLRRTFAYLLSEDLSASLPYNLGEKRCQAGQGHEDDRHLLCHPGGEPAFGCRRKSCAAAAARRELRRKRRGCVPQQERD